MQVQNVENESELKDFHFLTGEYVSVKAKTVEEAEALLAEGEYEFIEVQTELKFVGNA